MGLTVNSPGLGGQSTLSHFLDFLKIQLCRNPFGGQWQLTLFRAFCGIYDWARHQGSTLGTILFDSERERSSPDAGPCVQQNRWLRSLSHHRSKGTLAGVPMFTVKRAPMPCRWPTAGTC
jgi:hypothetical protein